MLDPIFFGPGAAKPPTYRFDSASGRFGVLYLGSTFAGALAETILRNPSRLMVAYADIEERAVSELRCRRELRFAKLYGDGLATVGTDNAISTGPYHACGLWADALWDHPDKPDGIAYQSRHNSVEICLAVFERTDIRFRSGPAIALTRILPQVANLLDAYGKSISTDSA